MLQVGMVWREGAGAIREKMYCFHLELGLSFKGYHLRKPKNAVTAQHVR
jgi:hypothetical protein